MNYFKAIDKLVWSIPTDQFNLLCTDPLMEPDSQGFPKQPNGTKEWRFSSIPNNISKVIFSNWSWVINDSRKGIFVSKGCAGIYTCDQCNCTYRPPVKKPSVVKKEYVLN